MTCNSKCCVQVQAQVAQLSATRGLALRRRAGMTHIAFQVVNTTTTLLPLLVITDAYDGVCWCMFRSVV